MKKSKFILLILITILHYGYNSQVVKKSFTKQFKKINLSQTSDEWMVNVQSMEMAAPGGESYTSFLLNQKEKVSQKYPRKKHYSNIKRNSLDSAIIIENGFEGNLYNNKVPNDNTIAISNDGIVVEAINSSYIIYDTQNDSLLKSGTLHSILVAEFWDLRFLSKYDPKVIYDPIEDRFILVFLAGKTPGSSHVCVAFTDSSDPTGDWNVYVLIGDALNTGHWTDYPAISITEDDLFITGNLLLNGVSWQLGFYQSIIWQVDKNSGYNGNDSLTFNLWSEFKDDSIYVRNIHPVRGARELQDDKQYFLSNKNFSLESDTMYLIKIENNTLSPNVSSSLQRLSLTDHYFFAPNGQQYNGQELATNDSRVLGGIIDEDWIQFVNHSMDTSSGTCGIYHGIIYDYDSVQPYVMGTIISDSVIDYGYPNIASTGINPNESECIIGFNYSSVSDTNGVACVYMQNNQYSNLTKLHKGEKAIDVLTGSVERWGDYSGIQRKYDEPCRVWMSGMYGKNIANGSWISSVAVSDTCRVADSSSLASINEQPSYQPSLKDIKVYPNPTIELTNINFNLKKDINLSIELFTIEGRLIKKLFHSYTKKGLNRLSFNTSQLNNGIYSIVFKEENNILFSKKLVKQ